jgi:hypothetical protein
VSLFQAEGHEERYLTFVLGGTSYDWGNKWIADHAAACAAANKPCFFEECEFPQPENGTMTDL